MNSEINPLEKTLPSFFDDGFIVFCGAGISIPPPSCSPSWWVLTEEILKAFFDRVPDDYNLPKDMILKDPDRQPEEVFESFANVLDERLYKAFEALDVAIPNLNHIALARLAKAGVLRACFTTNFDIYIERALKDEQVDYDLLVENEEYESFFEKHLKGKSLKEKEQRFILCKIHGTIERPKTIVSIASAYKSAKGFSSPKASVFEALIASYPCVFLGYSGYDFNHLNYRRFWERAGPKVQKILWNKRPNEGEGPDFKDIFRSCWQRFQYTVADLPDGLLKAIENASNSGIFVGDLTQKVIKDAAAQFAKAKENRIEFFKKWVKEFPESHMIGLVITESQKFSTTYRTTVKKYHEVSKDTEAVSYDSNAKMVELSQKYSKGEIKIEDYQKQMFEITKENLLRGIKNEYKHGIKQMINENKYPGITDNQSRLMTFLSAMMSTTVWYGLEEGASEAANYTYKSIELSKQTTEDARTELLILGFVIRLKRPDDDKWKHYVDQMYEQKKKLLSREIDMKKFSEVLSKIFQDATYQNIGMTVDLNFLFDKLVKAIMNSKTKGELRDQTEALCITMMTMASYLTSKLIESKAYKDMLAILSQQILPNGQKDPNKTIPKEILEKMDDSIRKDFIPIYKKAEKTDPIVGLLLEMGFLSVWIQGTQYLDTQGMKEYQRMWDAGEYPKRSAPKEIYKYLLEKNQKWIDSALNNLPARFAQILCGHLSSMGEMGDDFEMCKRATLESLKLSEGIVTEATPENIPGNLAAFYERRGDIENALKYYNLCLETIKLKTPPIWADAIIYRTALLYADKNDKKNALEIIGKYHSKFRGNACIVTMVSRKKAEELANKLAVEIGYKDVFEAIEKILA